MKMAHLGHKLHTSLLHVRLPHLRPTPHLHLLLASLPNVLLEILILSVFLSPTEKKTKHVSLSRRGNQNELPKSNCCMSANKYAQKSYFTALEFNLDLLLPWFEDGLSFTSFFATPVTTSNIVGSSFIMLKSFFLQHTTAIC